MHRTEKNIIYQIAYRIITIITPLITSPIINRALGPGNLGIYSATYAFANYFVFFAMLGIEKYGQRSIAAAKDREARQKLFWEIFSVQAFSSALAITAYIIAVFLTGGARTRILFIQGLWVLSCFLDINWFFFGCEEFKITVTRNFFVKTITVVSIIFLIRRSEDLLLYTFIMAGSTAVSQLLLWFSLFKNIRFDKPSLTEIRPHIAPILRLFIPVIALSVYHIMDKSMLDIFSTEENGGWYYAVDKIVHIPLGLITAIGTVMMTRISYALHNESMESTDNLLNKSSELVIFLTSAITFGIAAISKEFLPLFFGPGYEPCVNLMYMFLPVLVIKALGDIVRTQYLLPSKKDNIYIAAVFSGAFTNLVCNLLLIKQMGAKGAVIGTLSAEFVVLFVEIAGCKNEIHFIKMFMRHFYYIFIGMIMLLAVRIFAERITIHRELIKIIFMVLLGISVYFCFCLCVWIIKKDSIFYKILRARKLEEKR